MKPILPVTLAALSFTGHVAAADEAAISHQIVGKWQWIHAASRCAETYDYRPDGTLAAASGNHEWTAKYSVSEHQNAQGYYEVRIQPLTYSDSPRCPGNPLSGIRPHTAYVIFHRTQPLHLLCETPGLEKCLGPLRRISQ